MFSIYSQALQIFLLHFVLGKRISLKLLFLHAEPNYKLSLIIYFGKVFFKFVSGNSVLFLLSLLNIADIIG